MMLDKLLGSWMMERRVRDDDDDAIEIRRNGDQVVVHDVVVGFDLTGGAIGVAVATRQPRIQ